MAHLKTLAICCLTICVTICVWQVGSLHCSGEEQATVRFYGPPKSLELRETLQQATDLAILLYEQKHSSCELAIRLNDDLYQEEMGMATVAARGDCVSRYVTRAKKIESLAEAKLDSGEGYLLDHLLAKAHRIRALGSQEVVGDVNSK